MIQHFFKGNAGWGLKIVSVPGEGLNPFRASTLPGERGMDWVWPNLNFELLSFLASIPRTDFLQMPPR